MDFAGTGFPLTPAGIGQAANRLAVDPAHIWAILRVETSGCGFFPDRRPQMRFERHWFDRLTGSVYREVAPDLSNPIPGGSGQGGASEYDRLARAIALDRRAALRSASWGIGQVMGFNAESVGYADVEAMVAETVVGEDEQLRAVTGFIATQALTRPLQQEDWAAFARGYNGPDFAKNHYDAHLGDEYADLKANGLPDLRLRAAQMSLMFRGFDPGPIDGKLGNLTRSALRRFQAQAALATTGEFDAETVAALAQG